MWNTKLRRDWLIECAYSYKHEISIIRSPGIPRTKVKIWIQISIFCFIFQFISRMVESTTFFNKLLFNCRRWCPLLKPLVKKKQGKGFGKILNLFFQNSQFIFLKFPINFSLIFHNFQTFKLYRKNETELPQTWLNQVNEGKREGKIN